MRYIDHKIKGILISACIVASASVHAELVSISKATQVAQTFFNAAYQEVVPAPKLVANGRHLTTNRLLNPFYVFNHKRGGYVIVSADNKAFPILAYSTKRNFNRDQLSATEQKLLKKYAMEIELVRFDSRIPVRANASWNNINGKIGEILTAPYSQSSLLEYPIERREAIEEADRTGQQILMPTAIEFDLYDPDNYRSLNVEELLIAEGDSTQSDFEVPFQFFERFVKEINKERDASAISEGVAQTKPIVNALGGAHYELRFGEEIETMILYAIDGSTLMRQMLRDSNKVNLDLSQLPHGYYVAMVLLKSGQLSGIKLAR